MEIENRMTESSANDEIQIMKEQITAKDAELSKLVEQNTKFAAENAKLNADLTAMKESIAAEKAGKITISRDEFIETSKLLK